MTDRVKDRSLAPQSWIIATMLGFVTSALRTPRGLE